MRFNFKRYFCIIAIAFCILSWQVIRMSLIINLGQRVILEVEPIDPRDIFRGDYISLSLAINVVSEDKFMFKPTVPVSDRRYIRAPNEKDWERVRRKQEPVYVTLKEMDNKVYGIDQVYDTEPETNVFVIARVFNVHKQAGNVYLRFEDGLKRYYIQEGIGTELENIGRQGELLVEAYVWRGQVILTNLFSSKTK